ncbi:MAG: hypothetical protein RMJ07_06405 [Nitrososphaerota archaeon]|nr:hypothetical protein [Candidatus Bathyarchaeota archaeon]MDW8049287.1 hypothetical protein [Nitrososphaerota archaeon]
MAVRFGRDFLMSIKRRAIRCGVWFRVLGSAERAILSLAPKCVDTVKSPLLVDAIARIVVKVAEAMRSPLERLRSQIAAPLADRISRLAIGWGNPSAISWAKDKGFIQYLAVCKLNDVTIYV